MTKTPTKRNPSAVLALILATSVPAVVLAQSVLDTNGDGLVSLDEVQAVFPDVDSDAFMAADSDGDALLNADELAAAQDAGLIPMADG
ncbi:EF-hand domain-containing protein [Thalassococcus lentus]|uniref:EF-hand domain-containing protein n=1 Tax=Thalassococcus lentus TaxID=1210524 RepID=A0ABT4XQZ8_9RHOB|nr:hypothetical protein [Thalassococcus lentus]MDA7424380.1 hypothetical protein [Thalassococcus lentus]